MKSKVLIVLALSVGMSLGFVVSSLFKQPTENKVLSTNTKQSDDPASATSSPQSTTPAVVIFRDRVSKVIDGDTVVLDSGETVRYIGIDSPERGDCYSAEATEGNRALVEGKEVRLEKDVSERDKYGRLLRFLYIDEDGADQDVFVNDYLVRQGFAMAYRYVPDVAFSGQFEQAEQEARDNKAGLWANCEALNNSPTTSSSPKAIVSKSIEGDRDCSDFATHDQAQAFFEAAGAGDPHRLDSDGDGQACETLP